MCDEGSRLLLFIQPGLSPHAHCPQVVLYHSSQARPSALQSMHHIFAFLVCLLADLWACACIALFFPAFHVYRSVIPALRDSTFTLPPPALLLLSSCSLLLQENVSFQQRKIAELLRAYQRTASTPPQHTPDGPLASDSALASSSSGSSSSGGGGGGVGPAPTAARQQQQMNASGAARSFPSPIASWQDVAGGSGPSAGGGLYVPDGSSVAAAAAAAGVGAGPGQQTTVYTLLLETVLALATDPSPRVARLGRRVLGLAQMELAPLVMAGVPAPSVQRSTSGGQGLGLSPSSSMGGSAGAGSAGMGGYMQTGSAPSMPGVGSGGGIGGGVGASLGSLTSKLVKGGRSWRSGFASSTAAGGGMGGSSSSMRPGVSTGAAAALASSASVAGSCSGSPPGSPTSREAAAAAAAVAAQAQAFARQQYILRSTAPEQQQQYGAGGEGGDGMSASNLSRMSSGGGLGAGGADDSSPRGAAAHSAGSRGSLPASIVYASACEYFSRPMLEPQASAWRELEAHKVAPWTALQDGTRKAQRLREMEAARARCRGATNPRLREQVRFHDAVVCPTAGLFGSAYMASSCGVVWNGITTSCSRVGTCCVCVPHVCPA